jgi:microcystin-dependent protein
VRNRHYARLLFTTAALVIASFWAARAQQQAIPGQPSEAQAPQARGRGRGPAAPSEPTPRLADGTVNSAEGQSPSSVNDSARAMMAATAKYRDDIAGAIVTGGTSTAYTVTSYQVFDTLAHLDGQMIAFTPHATNGATLTLNVDSLGAKPLRSAPSTELLAGTLIQGTPYVAVYNNNDAVFYLQSFFGNPYNIPLGAGLPFFLPTAPNSSFVFPFGQAISRTTYSALFALMSTTYGTGDGSTTFNLPDLRGRTIAGKDDMGGSAASRLTNSGSGIVGATLGAVGGGETQTLTLAQLPTGITSRNASQAINVSGTNLIALKSSGPADNFGSIAGSGQWDNITQGVTINSTGNNDITVTSNNTSGNAHPIVQPTIVCNCIIRVI